MYRVGLACAMLVGMLIYYMQPVVGPVPQGDPISLAERMISDAGHSCPELRAADLYGDGSVHATCTNGETYRLVTINGMPLALRCRALTMMGFVGCLLPAEEQFPLH
jgi:hypothetical protein